MPRTICVGDIHGCVDEFGELLQLVQYDHNVDRLVLLGDLIDRGPDPAGVVRLARASSAECVRANHEEAALRWRRHEAKAAADSTYKNPMRAKTPLRYAQWAAIPDDDWAWLDSLPYFIHLDDSWTAIHAGAMPNVPFEAQRPNDLLRMRWIDASRTKMAVPNARGDAPEGAVHWTELWTGPRRVVYGHYVYDEVAKTFGDGPGYRTLGIDTGCCHGGALTAAIFSELTPGVNTVELHQVKAKKVYAERRPWDQGTD